MKRQDPPDWLEESLKNLKSSSKEVRQQGLTPLYTIREVRSVEPLIEAIQKEQDDVLRRYMVEALGVQHDKRSISLFLTLVTSDSNLVVRYASVEALAKLGGSVVIDQLMSILQTEPNDELRWYIAYTLGNLQDKRAFSCLLETFSNDESLFVRCAAAKALGKLGENAAVEPLLAIVLQVEAYEVDKAHRDLLAAAAEGLAELRDPRAVEPLLTTLACKDIETRISIIRSLGSFKNDRVVTHLLTLLETEDANLHAAACDALGEIGDPRAIEPLIRMLKSQYNVIHVSAIRALRAVGDVCAVMPLIAHLQSEKEPYTRREVVDVLDFLEDTRAVEPLAACLLDHDEDGVVKEAIAITLANFCDPRAVPTLIEALLTCNGEDHHHLRVGYIHALGKIGDTRAIGPVSDFLDDPDVHVRTAVCEAFNWSGDKKVLYPEIAALKDDFDCYVYKPRSLQVRQHIANSLDEMTSQRLGDVLIKALTDESQFVRLQAVIALGNLCDKRAIEPVAALLAEADRESYVGLFAAQTLGILGDQRAVEPLIEANLDDINADLRYNAAHLLGLFGDARAIEPLLNALHDENEEVRTSAAQALERLKEVK